MCHALMQFRLGSARGVANIDLQQRGGICSRCHVGVEYANANGTAAVHEVNKSEHLEASAAPELI
jgi:hypothetical protein